MLLEQLLSFLQGFTLFFWAAATWWIPLLILMFWRHGIVRYPLRYDPQYWSTAFPLAMYTTGTLRLVDALRINFLAARSHGLLWVATITWLATFVGLVHAIVRGFACEGGGWIG